MQTTEIKAVMRTTPSRLGPCLTLLQFTFTVNTYTLGVFGPQATTLIYSANGWVG